MKRHLAAASGLVAAGFMIATPAAAAPEPAGTAAGTSYLTAQQINPDAPIRTQAVTGDYLYWSFPATAGDRPTLAATVTLPAAADRHGPATWTVEVFDGLRRRQPCVAGAQTRVAASDATSVEVGCRVRQIRSWAEPSSSDPLPGTYYVRLAGTDLPEPDLGLPIRVDLSLTTPRGNIGADQGTLATPLTPVGRPGEVLTAVPPAAEPAASGRWDWPEPSSRWAWTVAGGVLAAVAGLVGFSLTRRRRSP